MAICCLNVESDESDAGRLTHVSQVRLGKTEKRFTLAQIEIQYDATISVLILY